MVKRAFAMVLGAVAGFLLWQLVSWVRAPAEADGDPVSFENCARDAYVDCVVQGDTPAVEDAPAEPIAQPCKEFLSDGAGVAALSECLHEVRRGNNAERIKAFERAQQIATSS